MRRLDQRIMYAHGTGFIVRRIGSGHSYGGTKYNMRYYMTAPAGYVIFNPNGRFLARVRHDVLRRWLNHFGLERLRNGR